MYIIVKIKSIYNPFLMGKEFANCCAFLYACYCAYRFAFPNEPKYSSEVPSE